MARTYPKLAERWLDLAVRLSGLGVSKYGGSSFVVGRAAADM